MLWLLCSPQLSVDIDVGEIGVSSLRGRGRDGPGLGVLAAV